MSSSSHVGEELMEQESGQSSGTYDNDNFPSLELQYLKSFYDSTNGQYWRENYTAGIPWNFTGDPNPCLDRWLGISCVDIAGTRHVSRMILPAYNLSGSIPNNVHNLTYLSHFNVGDNMISGTIPSTVGELFNLSLLFLYENQMTGTLPESIGYIYTLGVLDVGKNLFHGKLPDRYGNLTNLEYLYVEYNNLSGTIPSSFGCLASLKELLVGYNRFSGTIPDSFAKLTKIQEIIFYRNQLTGGLPLNWDNLTDINFIDWGKNLFTGTIPSNLGVHTKMKYFYANENFLTGTIPNELGTNFKDLIELYLYVNMLSGTVPVAFGTLQHMTDLSLDDNNLRGSLTGLFNASNQQDLAVVTISSNEFTGPLPEQLFRLPSLQVLLVAENCLQAALTETMCNSRKLSTLSLDGLATASSCRHHLLPVLSSAYVVEDSHTTPLPACIFQMSQLQTLHMSAIGLTGTLPGNITISPALTIVSLSHNFLSGSIPNNFQSHPWLSLDLSYNKLNGVLKSTLATNVTSGAPLPTTSLFLENNRISGGVPASIRNLVNISILGSNLLFCDLEGTDLPSNDDSSTYQCGSTSFEVPFYIWLALVGLVAMMIVSAIRYRKFWDRYTKQTLAYLRMWLTVSSGTYGQWQGRIKSVAIVSKLCELLCFTALWCLIYIIFVLLLVYGVLTYFYSTMTFSYAYTISAAYLSGTEPAAVMCVALVGLLVLLVAVFVRYLPSFTAEEMKIRLDTRSSRNLTKDPQQSPQVPTAARINNAFVYFTFITVNLAVVIGVNYAYIHAVVNETNKVLVISQVCIAFFKLVWGGAGINALVRLATKHLILNEADVRSRALETRFILLQIVLSLVNNIVIPCIVVAVVSESCYYRVFVPAPAVITYVPYGVCTSTVVERCTAFVSGNSVLYFDPPFKYDYQCSSSIIAIYAPAFTTLCIMTMFGVPFVELIARHWHSRSEPHSLLYRFIDRFLPRILKPIDVLNEEELQVQPQRYFHVNQLLVGLINLLALLLTFGAVFPPLAVAFTATLVAVIYFAKLKLGRFLCNAITAGRMNYVDLIEAECQRAGSVTVLYRSAWILIVFCCIFYTLYVFDTLGDAIGLSKAFWVLLALPLAPIVIYLLHSRLDVLLHKTGTNAAESTNQDAVKVELTVLGRTVSLVGELGEEDEATFNELLHSGVRRSEEDKL